MPRCLHASVRRISRTFDLYAADEVLTATERTARDFEGLTACEIGVLIASREGSVGKAVGWIATARFILVLVLVAGGCALMLCAAPRDDQLTAEVLVGR